MNTNTYSTMTEAMQGLRRRGFIANFEFLKNSFRDVDSKRAFKAEDLTIVEHHRFEGASDPEDMSVLYAIESTDGIRGVIADAFGVYANPELGSFLKNVKMHEDM